jgi:tetratricopeptide (TPR) repeat protein
MKSIALCLTLLTLGACQSPAIQSTDADVPIYYQIGVIQRTVSTQSAQAQLWFDRGLALTYGFNHEEAVVCFEEASRADPSCAMAHWGLANALGPNYNNPEMSADACAQAHASSQLALALMDHSTPAETSLIQAQAARYPTPEGGARAPLDSAYADALALVYQANPDDADVAALYAESLMQLNPWGLWSADGVMAEGTPAIRDVLEPALDRWPSHPALCHLYIHTMEAGPEVAKSIPAAQQLEGLTPGLGHLIHMPSHIYIWTGRYQDAVRVNQLAVQMDNAFVEHAGRANFYTLYRLHNYHFIAYGSMWEGQRALAMQAARDLVGEIPAPLLVQMADFLDIFTATPLHVMVRFGMWEEILNEPEPAPQLLAHKAVWTYARGLAFAALNRAPEAEEEYKRFQVARAAVPKSRLLFNNPVSDILAVADAVLQGEIAYRKGQYTEAFALLRLAVKLDVQMNYDEPWGWMEPARHALGALLTEQGHYEEAIEVYQANLQRYPINGWALHGLAECQQQLGLTSAAAATRKRFEQAWSRSDVTISGSCYCRTGTLNG